MDIDSLFPDDLDDNPTVHSLRRLIGDNLYEIFAADFGGSRIYVPERIGEHHPIAVSIGLDAAEKISHVYGKMEIDISPSAGLKVKVLRLFKSGVPKERIGPKVGVSRRHVYRIIAELDAADQLDLPL